MKRKEITIALKRPLETGPDGVAHDVVVREPQGKDVFELGNPGQYMRTRDGAVTYIENNDVIHAYAERCIIKPDPLVAIKNMSVIDTLAVRDAIIGFFLDQPAASDT